MQKKLKAPENFVPSPETEKVMKEVFARIDANCVDVHKLSASVANFGFSSKTPASKEVRVAGVGILGNLSPSEEHRTAILRDFLALVKQIEKGGTRLVPIENCLLHPLKQRDAFELLKNLPNKEARIRFCQTLVEYALADWAPKDMETRMKAVELFGDIPSTPENRTAAYQAFKKAGYTVHPKPESKELTDSDVFIVGTSEQSILEQHERNSDASIVLEDDENTESQTNRPIISDNAWESIIEDEINGNH